MNRLLPIGLIAFIAAALAIFFFGDSGIVAFQGLTHFEQDLSANVEALKERNRELQAELDRVRSDPDANRVLARSVGLYEPGEEVIRLVGRSPRPEAFAVGDLLRMRRPAPGRNAVIKEAALGAALVLIVLSLLAFRRKTHGASSR